MGWAPYSMGMWSWYPGMGYTWISGEPWGWMPYHFGSWNFSPALAMAGRLLRQWAGRPIAWGCGAGIQAWVTRGFPESPGAGCLITSAVGIFPRLWLWLVAFCVNGLGAL